MITVDILNPFLVAAAEVLQSTTLARVTRGDLSIFNSTDTVHDVTVTLSVVGEVQGTVLYSLSERTALNLVGQMLGSPIHELDALARSGIAELGNIITGRAATKLASAGYESNISTPNVIVGSNMRIFTHVTPRIVVELETECGPLEVHLAITDGVPD